MISTNTNFDTYNASRVKKPVVVIELYGISTIFCSNTFSGITSSYKQCINNLVVIPLNFDKLDFKTIMGGYDFTLIDIDSAVLNELDQDLYGLLITVKIGFQELTINDFVTLPIAYIVEYGQNSKYEYWFKSRLDILPTKPIFQNLGKTKLSLSLPASATEHLNNGSFSSASYWTVAGDCSITSGVARFVFSTGSGTLTQSEANLAKKGVASRRYQFQYTISNKSGTPTASITTSFASISTSLDMTAGAHTIWFQANDNPQAFVISSTLGGGEAFDIDNISLEECLTIVDVDDTTSFSTASTPAWDTEGTVGTDRRTMLYVGGEIMEYTAKTSTTFTVTRANNNTTSKEHSEGADVYEVIYVSNVNSQGLDFFMSVLTTTSVGSNGAWDKGIAYFGLGISISNFDINQIRNEWQKWQGDASLRCIYYTWYVNALDGFDDGIDWTEKKMLAWFGGYFFMTDIGKIGVKFFDVTYENGGYWDIDLDSIILNQDQINIEARETISHLQINKGIDSSKIRTEAKNNTTIAEYGNMRKIIIDNDYSGIATLVKTLLLDRYFTRFGNPSVRYKFDAFLSKQLHQIGDVINLTNADLTWFLDGSVGWENEGCEIVDKSAQYSNEQSFVHLECDNFYAHRKAVNFAVVCWKESEIDDTTLSVNADHAAGTLQSADAYLDAVMTNVDRVMVAIQFTEPGQSGGSESVYFTLYLKIQNPINTDVAELEKHVYYNEKTSNTKIVELYALNLGNTTVERVRVDWTAATSGTYAPTNVKLIKVKQVNIAYSITTTDI